MRQISLRFIVITAAVTAWPLVSPMAKPGTVFLTTYLRAGPGNQYLVLDEIRPEAQVDVEACQNGWCKVNSQDSIGYIDASVLSAPNIHAAPPSTQPSGPCVTADLNGAPRGGDTVKVCDR